MASHFPIKNLHVTLCQSNFMPIPGLKTYLVSEVSTVLRKYTDRTKIGVSVGDGVVVFGIVGLGRVSFNRRRKNRLLLRRMRNNRRNWNDIILFVINSFQGGDYRETPYKATHFLRCVGELASLVYPHALISTI